MEEFNFNNELIKISTLINNERVLVIDSGSDLVDEINKRKLNVHITYCDSDDFTSLTRYPEDHMNAFDVIFCPSCLYNIQAENRQLVLQFIVWAMKDSSRLVFSVPNINRFVINNEILWKGSKCYLKEDSRFFKITKYTSLFKPNTWLRADKEFWHKTTVRFPLQNFHIWNTENPMSQWDLKNLAVKGDGDYIFCVIDMRKPIHKNAL